MCEDEEEKGRQTMNQGPQHRWSISLGERDEVSSSEPGKTSEIKIHLESGKGEVDE